MSRRRQRITTVEEEEWVDPFADPPPRKAGPVPTSKKRHLRESETESENDDNITSSPSSAPSPVAKRGTQLKRSLFTISAARPGVVMDSKSQSHSRSRPSTAAASRQPLPPVEPVLRGKRSLPTDTEWDNEEDILDSTNSSEKSDILSVSSTDSERGQPAVARAKSRPTRSVSPNPRSKGSAKPSTTTSKPSSSSSSSSKPGSRAVRPMLRPIEVRLDSPSEVKLFPPLPRSLRSRGSDINTFVLRVIGDMDSILPSSPPARKQQKLAPTAALLSPSSQTKLPPPAPKPTQPAAQSKPNNNAKRRKTMNSRTAARATPVHLTSNADAKATATFYNRVTNNRSLTRDPAPVSWAHLRQPAMTCRTAQGARRLARRVFRTIDNTISPFEDDDDEAKEDDDEAEDTESAHSAASTLEPSEPAVPDFASSCVHFGDRYLFPGGRPVIHLSVSTRGSSILYSVVNPASSPRAKTYVHCPSLEAIVDSAPLHTRSHKAVAPKRPAIFPFDDFPPPKFIPTLPEHPPALKRKSSKSCISTSSSDETKPTRSSSQSRGLRVDTSETDDAVFEMKGKDNKRGQSRNNHRSPQARSRYTMESPHKLENRNGNSVNTSSSSRSKNKRSSPPSAAKPSNSKSAPPPSPTSPFSGTSHGAARKNRNASGAMRTRGSRTLRPRSVELPA